MIRFSGPVLFGISLLFAVPGFSQTWSYTGSKTCFDYGNGMTQCFSRDLIEDIGGANRRSSKDIERSFEAGQQLGQGVGSLIVALAASWRAHRQVVKAVTNDYEQLQQYIDAENSLIEEFSKIESDDGRLFALLERLDPQRRAHWEQSTANARNIYEENVELYKTLQKVHLLELQQKSAKAISQLLNNPRGVTFRYELRKRMASQAYVLNQFLSAVVGSYQQKATSPVPSTEGSAVTNERTSNRDTATVTVESSEPTAKVYLDNLFVGDAPTVLKVSSGNHVFRVSAGTSEWQRSVPIPSGSDLRLRPSLDESP
jgi:PEGA domain